MTRDQIATFLGHFGIKPTVDQSRTGWVISECPFGTWWHENGHSNPQAFAIKLEPGDSFANCFSCGWHGKQSDIVFDIRNLHKQNPQDPKPDFGAAFELIMQAENTVDLDFTSPSIEDTLLGKHGVGEDDDHVFPENWLQSFPPVGAISWALDYLISRNVEFKQIGKFDLRADTKRMRVCCPVRDFHGRLRGLHGRSVDDENPESDMRYRMYRHNGKKNPSVWLGEHWVDVNRPVVMVEGFFDAISVARVYDNVISPLYASPSFLKIRRISDCMEIITLFDRGKGGDVGRTRINKALPKHHIIHLWPTAKDPGEMGLKDLMVLLSPYVKLTA